jgi:hypothetical protein
VYHLIEFRTPFTADVATSPRDRLHQLRIEKGTQFYVHLLPHTVQTPLGPVEVADMCWEDGSVAREVPYARFRFVG